MLYPIELRAHFGYFKHFDEDLVKDERQQTSSLTTHINNGLCSDERKNHFS